MYAEDPFWPSSGAAHGVSVCLDLVLPFSRLHPHPQQADPPALPARIDGLFGNHGAQCLDAGFWLYAPGRRRVRREHRPVLQRIFAPAGDLRLTQPVNYADGRNPPMLLIHGRDDSRVRPATACGWPSGCAAPVGQPWPGLMITWIIPGQWPAWPLRCVGGRIWRAWWADLRDVSRRHRPPIH